MHLHSTEDFSEYDYSVGLISDDLILINVMVKDHPSVRSALLMRGIPIRSFSSPRLMILLTSSRRAVLISTCPKRIGMQKRKIVSISFPMRRRMTMRMMRRTTSMIRVQT